MTIIITDEDVKRVSPTRDGIGGCVLPLGADNSGVAIRLQAAAASCIAEPWPRARTGPFRTEWLGKRPVHLVSVPVEAVSVRENCSCNVV